MPIQNETVMENQKKQDQQRAEVAKRRRQERALEEGLEESMAGSDPVSITQPSHSPQDKRDI